MFNSKKRLVSLLVFIDGLAITVLLSQFGLPKLNLIGIFDYYLTYAIIIFLTNIIVVLRIIYLSLESERIDRKAEWEKLKTGYISEVTDLLGGGDWLDTMLEYKLSHELGNIKEGLVNSNILKIIREGKGTLGGRYQFNFKLTKLEEKRFNEITSKYNSLYNENQLLEDFNVADEKYLKETTFGALEPMIALVSIIGIGTGALILSFIGNAKISEHNIIKEYMGKYSVIEDKINIVKSENEKKEKVINKLTELKTNYIKTYGTGSEIITQIDNDIQSVTNTITK